MRSVFISKVLTCFFALLAVHSAHAFAQSSASSTERKIDQTGIDWVTPFSKVMEEAKSQKRLIAIKMIAFGTNSSGCW